MKTGFEHITEAAMAEYARTFPEHGIAPGTSLRIRVPVQYTILATVTGDQPMAAEKSTPALESAPVASKTGPTTESERANVNRFKENVPIGYGGKVDANGWKNAVSPSMGKK